MNESTNLKELQPLIEEIRKYGSADEFTNKLKNVLEDELPELSQKFDELERVATRTKGKRGASRSTINKVFDDFVESGRQVRKIIVSALGYKDIRELPYLLSSEIETLTDPWSFEPNSERWIKLINNRLSEITKGHTLSDLYNQVR
jgi:hypothetical protein